MFYFLLQGYCYKTPQQSFGIGLCRALCTVRERRNCSTAAGMSHEQLFLWYFCPHYKASNCIRMHPLVIFEALLPIPYVFSERMGWKCHCRENGNILRFIIITFLSNPSTDLNYDVHISKQQISTCAAIVGVFFSVLRSEVFAFMLHSLWHTSATNTVIENVANYNWPA